MAPTPKKIVVMSSDGEKFEVEEAVAFQSETIKQLVEIIKGPFPVLPCVTGRILSKVLEYCKKHADAAAADNLEKNPQAEDDLKAWDTEFVQVDENTLCDLFLAATDLNIDSLSDLTCRTIAYILLEKTPEEIDNFFIPNSTPMLPPRKRTLMLRMTSRMNHITNSLESYHQ